jgi:hypothetical protein
MRLCLSCVSLEIDSTSSIIKTQKQVFDLAISDKKTEHLERSNKKFRALCITHTIFDVLR